MHIVVRESSEEAEKLDPKQVGNTLKKVYDSRNSKIPKGKTEIIKSGDMRFHTCQPNNYGDRKTSRMMTISFP